MQHIITDDDLLMGEFHIPADYFISRKLTIQANTFMCAYVGPDSVFYVLAHNKDNHQSSILLATQDATFSAKFFAEVVESLGYTKEQQMQEAMQMIGKLFKEFPPDSDPNFPNDPFKD